MRAVLLVFGVLGCSGIVGPHEGAPDLFDEPPRGSPDPARAIPPVCVLGTNCLRIEVPATPALVAPDAVGGAWVSFPVGQGNDSDGIFELGALSAPFGDNSLYGDTFLAHVDASGTWDALTALGDANVMAMDVGPDGAVVLIGTFYPQATLDGVLYNCGTFDSDFWVGVVEAGGGWRWVQVLPRTANSFLAPSAVGWDSDGDVVIGVLGTGTLGGMEVPGEDLLSVFRLDGGSGDALWSRELGIGIPTQFFVDDDGALYLAGGGSFAYGGVVLGVSVPFPNLFMARIDGQDDWVASAETFHGVLLSGVWARAADGGFVLGAAWATASQPVNDGTLTFGGLPALPMAPWQDGAIAAVSSAGEWSWARRTDAVQRLAILDQRMWTLSQAIAYDAFGNISGFPEANCELLADGAPRACRASDEVVGLAVGGGLLWRTQETPAPLERIEP